MQRSSWRNIPLHNLSSEWAGAVEEDFLRWCPTPLKRRLPGRPKKKRRLEQWELKKNDTELRKGDHQKRYRVCREMGHNRSNYPQLPQQTQPTKQPPPIKSAVHTNNIAYTTTTTTIKSAVHTTNTTFTAST